MSTIKNIQSINSSKTIVTSQKILTQDQVLYSLCDRNNLSESSTNYFVSFNLPINAGRLRKTDSLSKSYPELYQLNVDKIIVIPIDPYYYSEYIDGSSLTLYIPQSGSNNTIRLNSTTYSTVSNGQSSVLLGDNVSFLFADSINRPYSGTTNAGKNVLTGRTTWNVYPRFAAVSQSDFDLPDLYSDKRPWSLVKQAFGSGSTMATKEQYPSKEMNGYTYDIPCGFISIDKGYIVITHQDIVNNFPWTSGYQGFLSGSSTSTQPQTVYHSTALNDGNTYPISKKNIIFPSSLTVYQNPDDLNNNILKFKGVRTDFKTSVVCIALPGEFYISQNPSWDTERNITEKNNGGNSFDDIYVTEIGLYNSNNELIAVAKFSEPVKKSFNNVISFSLDISV